jgi:hypothetical protein
MKVLNNVLHEYFSYWQLIISALNYQEIMSWVLCPLSVDIKGRAIKPRAADCFLCLSQFRVFLHESCSGGSSAEWSLAGTATVITSDFTLNHTANPNA